MEALLLPGDPGLWRTPSPLGQSGEATPQVVVTRSSAVAQVRGQGTAAPTRTAAMAQPVPPSGNASGLRSRGVWACTLDRGVRPLRC